MQFEEKIILTFRFIINYMVESILVGSGGAFG